MGILRLLRGEDRRAAAHRKVFHAFAESLARVIRTRRPTVRVRAVDV